MTKEEKNRVIAEWLEPMVPPLSNRRPMHCGGSPKDAWIGSADHEWEPSDFFTDESASALILEKMPCPKVMRVHESLWSCSPNWPLIGTPEGIIAGHEDRKTCIAEAALKLIEP